MGLSYWWRVPGRKLSAFCRKTRPSASSWLGSGPPGWKEAYRDWAAAGWNAVSLPAQWGGQALPHALNAACIEMWNSASMAFGIGPVIERMLYQMGVGTFRQIAQWSERDIDEFDARLREFPGRIRRDAWVTQARALHASKYGSPP